MAYSTDKGDPKAKTASKSKIKVRDRVVKRPARGFHRFRGGMLNVTPKGGEKELVKRNQDSLLLQLPAELRRQIWEYVLGGTTVKAMSYGKDGKPFRHLAVPIDDRPHSLCLLRVCRQIYSETATLPYRLNTFVFWSYESIMQDLKSLRPFQRASITRIQFANCYAYGHLSLLGKKDFAKARLGFLPALKHVHVLLHQDPLSGENRVEQATKRIEDQLDVLLAGTQVETLIEVRQSSWNAFCHRWISLPKTTNEC